MKINKLSIVIFAALSAMFSCTNESGINSSTEYVSAVRVTVEDFIPESSTTRTAYTVDNTGFHFKWADGDALGIYPVGGDQVKFPISGGDGAKSAVFDGGSWKLRSNYQYAAYYPFSTANYTIDQRELPVSYGEQTQNGNNSTAHLAAYDYLACAATTPDENGGVDFTMKHLGAFVRLQLTMPQADTYHRILLESDGNPFVTAGTFDLTAETPAITSTATSQIERILLDNISTTSAGELVTVYAMVAPVDLSASNIKVTVLGEGNTSYVQTVKGKNFEAGSAYNIVIPKFSSGTNASNRPVNWDPDLLSSAFSVGATKKVLFTKGNLYWDGSDYHFESNQTDHPTSWNASHVGHFFWTNCTDYKNNTNMPYSASYSTSTEKASDEFWCGENNKLTVDYTEDLYVLTGGADGEWQYLLKGRTNASNLCKCGVTVGGVSNCLVIAPDNFSGTLQSSYTLDEANNLSLVCLPLTDSRIDTNYYVGGSNYGNYWSATPYGDNTSFAYSLRFYSSSVSPSYSDHTRESGLSIRLVQNINN